jgi:polyhydroxyalkanoate synthase
MDAGELTEWAATNAQLQQLWLDFATHQATAAAHKAAKGPSPLDPAQWLVISQSMLGQMPKGMFEASAKLAQDQMQLWSGVMERFVAGATGGKFTQAPEAAALPKSDRRFADPAWREHPAFVLLHQTYLMLAEQIVAMGDKVPGLDADQRKQLKFTSQAIVDALSPANFPLTNPVVLERTLATKGDNLVKGMEHLINDMKRGQLTHTDPNAFRLGENLAATPGKVVHETPLYQLIQYSPATPDVLEVPLIIFPPWINRFYILDLTPKKSFIKWAVDQGITVFVVSWKSADETMGDVM